MLERASLIFGSRTAAVAAILFTLAPAESRAMVELADLAGTWRGSGTVHLANGESEQIKCRATYSSAGVDIDQVLKCANPRYYFNVRSDLTQSGNSVAGNWIDDETEDSGRVSGKVSENTVALDLTGSGFTGSLSITVSGCSQAVNLVPNSSTVNRVSVTLRKRGCD